jgi:hypothetical protein
MPVVYGSSLIAIASRHAFRTLPWNGPREIPAWILLLRYCRAAQELTI